MSTTYVTLTSAADIDTVATALGGEASIDSAAATIIGGKVNAIAVASAAASIGDATYDASTGLWTDTSHGLSVGDEVYFSAVGNNPATAVDDATRYVVIEVPDANTYRLGNAVGGIEVTREWGAEVGNATFAASTDLWTSAGHGLSNGDAVRFTAVGTGATDGGSAVFELDTVYYVVSALTDTFGLAATSGGSAITGDADSVGTWTLQQAKSDGTFTVASLAVPAAVTAAVAAVGDCEVASGILVEI